MAGFFAHKSHLCHTFTAQDEHISHRIRTAPDNPVTSKAHSTRKVGKIALSSAVFSVALAGSLVLTACSGSGGSGGSFDEGTTEGPNYSQPSSIYGASYNANEAKTFSGGSIDTAHVAEGYVAASAQNASRLKLQILCNNNSYNYDLPSDGTPIVCPLNMGNGQYTFRIMQNTSGNNYVEIASTTASVSLTNEFEPYVRPNLFCDFSNSSTCVSQARELTSDASNEGDVVRSVYEWVVKNISYDYDKAEELSGTTGYIPNPDETMESRSGICFDYASLAAAMLRSLGIPCQIITGYVSPDSVYHAWNMVYINGRWISVQFSIEPDTWTRMDLTFAAAGAGSTVGDGTDYTDRYVY